MRAIVLRRTDFRENDQLITLLTREKGKISALARGVKKIVSKNSSYLEPFFYIEMEMIPGRELKHITKVTGLDIFKNIRADLDKCLLAVRAVNIVDNLILENERDASVFELLLRWLQFIDQNNAGSAYFFGFVARLFKIIGFAPIIKKCVACGKTPSGKITGSAPLNFLPVSGGLICRGCLTAKKSENPIALRADDIAEWHKFLDGAIDEWPEKISSKLEAAIWNFAEYHSERKLAKVSEI
jgi:DNA repair protein RecO (recombination protein O)